MRAKFTGRCHSKQVHFFGYQNYSPKKRNILSKTHAKRLAAFARTRGAIRAKELDALGIPRTDLSRLVARGELIRVARGLYMSPDAELTAHHSLVEVALRVPDAVINLLSALTFHDLTTELPHLVWLTIPEDAHAPTFASPRLEVTWSKPALLEDGIDEHLLEGVAVRVTSPARTVADCFKFRSKVGLSTAVDALKDYLSEHRAGRDELWRMAGLCRVRTVMRPYIEALS